RMAAARRRHSAARPDRLAEPVRSISREPAICRDQPGHDARRLQDDLLVGIYAPAVGPADRLRLPGAAALVRRAAPYPAPARAVAPAALSARRAARRRRLVDGGERARPGALGQRLSP